MVDGIPFQDNKACAEMDCVKQLASGIKRADRLTALIMRATVSLRSGCGFAEQGFMSIARNFWYLLVQRPSRTNKTTEKQIV